MATERQRGVKGAPRTELVTIRFDPRTKYLMELAARVQRRSIANFVEWAIDDALRGINVDLARGQGTRSLKDAGEFLWDIDEADRFAILGYYLPQLLTHEEQILWRLLEETDSLWGSGKGERAVDGPKLRKWFPAAKYAVSTGADIETIRAALRGEGAAVQAIGLDKWAASRKGEDNG